MCYQKSWSCKFMNLSTYKVNCICFFCPNQHKWSRKLVRAEFNRIQGKEHYTRYTDLLKMYGSFHLEDVNSLNLYLPNYITSICVKNSLTEIRREVDKATLIEAGYNMCLSVMDKTNGIISKASEWVNKLLTN